MNRAGHISLTIFLLLLACNAFAQGKGDVVVHSDPRLSILMKKQKVAPVPVVRPGHSAAEKRMAAATTHPAPGTEAVTATTPANTKTNVTDATGHPVVATKPGTTATPIASGPHVAMVNGHPVAEPAARTGTTPALEPAPHVPAEHTPPATAASTAPPAKVPVFHLEKEGRVIYSGKGFRVQIYSGSDRDQAISIKKEFMRNFPNVRTYITYVSPCFRVKVGNYRHRSDAMGMLKEAKGMYSPCVIVPDIITINTF